jgi:hypothetical protein
LPLPGFTITGDLPPGVHRATLTEVLQRFGAGTHRRQLIALRLERICQLSQSTGHVARTVVFGSFVTTKPAPNDVDLFLLMEDAFSGSDAWQQWVARTRPSRIGKQSAMGV